MTLSESEKQTIKSELKKLYPEKQEEIERASVEPEAALPPQTFKMSIHRRIGKYWCKLICTGLLTVFSIVAIFVSPVENEPGPYFIPNTPTLIQTVEQNFWHYYSVPADSRQHQSFRPDEEQSPLSIPTPSAIFTAITGSAPEAATGSVLTMPLYVSGLSNPNDYRRDI